MKFKLLSAMSVGILSCSLTAIADEYKPLNQFISHVPSLYGTRSGALDLSNVVPPTATRVKIRSLLDANGGANDGILFHIDQYPQFGNFTGFENNDNLAMYVDINNGTEEQVSSTLTVDLDEFQQVGWKSVPSSGASSYDLMFWIDGYYEPELVEHLHRESIHIVGTRSGSYSYIFDVAQHLNKDIEYAQISVLIDVNGGANDGILVYADGAPAGGNFTGFANQNNLLGYADVAWGTEEQVEMSVTVPVVDGKIAWQVIPSSGASSYDMRVWLNGYITKE